MDIKKVEQKAKELNNDLLEVAKELKRLQSVKCRLKKQMGKSTYEADMTKVLKEEELLKQVRQLLDPKEKPVTMYEQADVDQLDYDELVKARRSIQSKKSLTKYLTTEPGDNDEYRSACRIEEMLTARIEKVKPVDNEHVRKSDVQTIIDTIESSGKLSQKAVLELLKKLV